ncbi:hypothetical protein A3D03_03970 [Candidatus Gottesmanbacteria bacterium RIFCSPHIGHO2_02_FULL_40_13]|uniref:Uncharacterized protein n=1 Tax=Candidatus Gottesmanbacteria bacterium RIFCSPHIGHO2_02_FULL_40_13 TaxID=1798384 RepID=A0A1F6A7U9_9BACT|nr:MAG: hypothetical protein A3D03_03970 [Candidatus Gottesmanbacteria bacterium RIFCSPHIGHO2_02_FULL_40_13]
MVAINAIENGTTAPGSIITDIARSPIVGLEASHSAPNLVVNSHAYNRGDGLNSPLNPQGIVFEGFQTPYQEMRNAASEVLRDMGIKHKIEREEMLRSFDRLREGDEKAVEDFQATLSDFQDGVVDPILKGLHEAVKFVDEQALNILTGTEIGIGAAMAGYLAVDYLRRRHDFSRVKRVLKHDGSRTGSFLKALGILAGFSGILAGCTGLVWATTTLTAEAPPTASSTLPPPQIKVTHNAPPSAPPSETPSPVPPEDTPMPETVNEASYNAHALLDTIPEENHIGNIISKESMSRLADGRDTLTGWSQDAAKAKLAEMQSVLDNLNPELVKDEAIFAKTVYLVLSKDGKYNFIILVNDTVPEGTIAGDTLWHSATMDDTGKVIFSFQPNANMGLGVNRFGNWVGPGGIDGKETFLKAVDLTPVGGIQGLLDGRGRIVFDGNGIAYIVALNKDGQVTQVFDAASGSWLPSEIVFVPEPVATLTNEQIVSMDDGQILQQAPQLNSTEYQFDTEFPLVADEVIRGGEGANYVVYKDETGNYHLVWNIETGEVNHAIYAPAYEGEIGGEVHKGIPLLVLTDNSVLKPENGGGWFGLNPDYTDAQARIAEAFQIALGMRYWDSKIKPADNFPFSHGLPDFKDVPGYETLKQELERYFSPPNHAPIPHETPKYLRVKIANYLRDKFLLDLKTAKEEGMPFLVRMKDKGRTYADLAGINTFIIDFTDSGKMTFLGDNQRRSESLLAYNKISYYFISALTAPGSFRLTVDNWKYDYNTNRWFGGEFLALLRYAFAGQYYAAGGYELGRKWVQESSSDFTHQIAAEMLSDKVVADNPELAEILDDYALSYPFLWWVGYPPDWFTNSSAVQFVKP